MWDSSPSGGFVAEQLYRLNRDRPALGAMPGPVGFTQLITESGRLYGRHFLRLLVVFAPVLIVLSVVAELLAQALDDARPPALGTVLVSILVGVILPTAALTYLYAATHVILADAVAGLEERGRVSATLRLAARDLALTAFLSATLALITSLIPLPGLRALVWGPPILISIVVLERTTLRDAWISMNTRMRGHWGRVILGYFSLALVLTILQGFAIGGLAVALDLTDGSDVVLLAIVGGTILGLSLPYLAAATLVLYFDVRARSESFGSEELRRERRAALT